MIVLLKGRMAVSLHNPMQEIPVQRCFQREYQEYAFWNGFYQECALPVTLFHIRFAKDVTMLYFPHACTLLYFEVAPQAVYVSFVGRVTETMKTFHRGGSEYYILRFPPQFIFRQFEGIQNKQIPISCKVFGKTARIRDCMALRTLEEQYNGLISLLEGSTLGFQLSPILNQCIFTMLQMEEEFSVKELAHQMGYTTRSIRNFVRKSTGISTKRFYDILRLQKIIDSQIYQQETVANCIFENGFYDQPHLYKNIKRLTGYPYAEFIKLLREKNQQNR